MEALQIKHSLAKPAVVEMPNPIDTANVDTPPRPSQKLKDHTKSNRPEEERRPKPFHTILAQKSATAKQFLPEELLSVQQGYLSCTSEVQF